MFEELPILPPDSILGLAAECRADPNPDKVDLTIGIYMDEAGLCPVFEAIKQAQRCLVEEEQSKAYLSPQGDPAFLEGMMALVLGAGYMADHADRVGAVQSPGGCGAVRLGAEVLKASGTDGKVWISDPSWPVHVPLITSTGLALSKYRYYDPATHGVDFEAMVSDLAAAGRGDIVLLHGCCHNPTGANIDMDTWKAITELVIEKDVMPLVDIAYQGFGDGLDEDAAPLRYMASRVSEMYVAASCSKNFGLYRDRVGIAMLIAEDALTAAVVQGNLATLNRLNYSFAPDHGAALVAIILNDPALRAEWMQELGEMRDAMLKIRQNLADALRQQCNSDRFDFIAEHRGMFSRLGLAPDLVDVLRDQHGMYVVGDSRINIAGLAGGRYQPFANAVAQVVSVS